MKTNRKINILEISRLTHIFKRISIQVGIVIISNSRKYIAKSNFPIIMVKYFVTVFFNSARWLDNFLCNKCKALVENNILRRLHKLCVKHKKLYLKWAYAKNTCREIRAY